MSPERTSYTEIEQAETQIPPTKLYKKRWLILIIYISYALLNSCQWLNYAMTSNATMKYYKASRIAVSWTGIVYLALYAPLLLPASYLVDKMGLRVSALVGGLLTTTATILKLFANSPETFWIILLCQTMLAVGRTVIVGLPPRIAAVWFGPHEVSTACGLAVVGTHIGTALGMLMSDVFVANSVDLEQIGKEYRTLNLIYTAIAVPSLIAILFCFQAFPKIPPSVTQIAERNEKKNITIVKFVKSFIVLFTKKGFAIHVLAFGLTTSIFGPIGNFLDDFTLEYFPHERFGGKIGFVGEIAALFGASSGGFILDKTHKYKETCVLHSIMVTLSSTGIVTSIYFSSKIGTFISIAVFGCTGGALVTSCIETAVELTHPFSEMATGSTMIASSQLMGALSTIFGEWLLSMFGFGWTFFGIVVIVIVGNILAICTPNLKNRQMAYKSLMIGEQYVGK